MAVKTIYPPGYNIIDHNPDYFLLHIRYDSIRDDLHVLYKKYSDGEKVLKIIHNPMVPVFISLVERTKREDYVDISECRRVLVHYKTKEEEMKAHLFQPKEIKYRDQFYRWTSKVIYPNVAPGSVLCNPNVFLYDYDIVQLGYLEYAIWTYENQDGLNFENIPIPDLHICSFDIETNTEPNAPEVWHINTNTFVDPKGKTAYIDFAKNPRFARQEEILPNLEKFKAEIFETLHTMIDSCTLKKGKDKVQEIARNFVDSLSIEVRQFDTESELILQTTKKMFTEVKPDILTAFNTTYDIGMFCDRIRDLGLRAGTLNEQGIGFDDITPPVDTWMCRNADGSFRGDDYNPTKRVVYLNNFSHTLIADSQTVFFSNRSTRNFSNYSLQTAAEDVLGFGKLDYSHITNNILYLAEKDFWTHSIYAVIDSILLIIMDLVTEDYRSKMIYCMSCKVNIEASPQNNSAITCGYLADAIVDGKIPGNNMNKAVSRMQVNEVKAIEKTLNVQYLSKLKTTLNEKVEFGGGIVLQPALYHYDWKALMEMTSGSARNVLNDEVTIQNFRRVLNAVYLDFKSHYPSTIVSRNLSIGTLFGVLTKVFHSQTGEILLAADRKMRNIFTGCVRQHLGDINLAIISDDIITYGNLCCGLPSAGELINQVVEFDSEPKFTPPVVINPTVEKPSNKYHAFLGVLSKLNTYTYDNHFGSGADNKKDDTQEEKEMKRQEFELLLKQIGVLRDKGYFLLNNGELRYNGTYVNFYYPNYTLWEALQPSTTEVPQYAKYEKGEIFIDNEMRNLIRRPKFELPNDLAWNMISAEDWIKIADIDLVSQISNLFGTPVRLNKYLFYFPWDPYLKLKKKTGTVKKYDITEPIYRVWKQQATAILELVYTIIGPDDLHLCITQQMQVVLLEDKIEQIPV